MTLLLLLSALFSALTGANIGAQRPEVAQAVAAQSVASQPSRVARALRTDRPVATLPSLLASAAMVLTAPPALLATVDLWASRRRE